MDSDNLTAMGINVLIVSSEAIPFAKTGGLADVAGSLAKELKELGCNVALAIPLYRSVVDRGYEIKPAGTDVSIKIGFHTIKVPLHSFSMEGIKVYFPRCDEYFDRGYLYGTPDGDYFDNLERFTLFTRVILEGLSKLGIHFDLIHCNDWQTGLIPAYLKSIFRKDKNFHGTASLFTIHNIAYQGIFPSSNFSITGLPKNMFTMDGLEYWGNINLLKAGIVYSDIITTVSKRYSQEIQGKEFGCGLDGILRKRNKYLYGVLNGVDYREWNPENDRFIAARYSRDNLAGKKICKKDLLSEFGLDISTDTPLIGMVSRLAEQKGFDILIEAMPEIMKMRVGMAILGTGERRYHDSLSSLSTRYAGRLAVKLSYDERLAHKIEAGADMFLMPSKYEPCGLNQIYSLKYGTVPIVRATGGLADTIKEYNPAKERGNGFKFYEYTPSALEMGVKRAITPFRDREVWTKIMKNGMAEDFSWRSSAKQYVALYKKAMEIQRNLSSDR